MLINLIRKKTLVSDFGTRSFQREESEKTRILSNPKSVIRPVPPIAGNPKSTPLYPLYPIPLYLLPLLLILSLSPLSLTPAQYYPVVPIDDRGGEDYVRQGTHDANRIRTLFFNYGMVGNYPPDPGNVDYTIFHSMEWPKGSLENYTDGVTPFVLAKLKQSVAGQLQDFYIMETGYRERQETNPTSPLKDPKRGGREQRFNPRPGYLQLDPSINIGRSPAVSYDPRTWPNSWPDKANDPDDPGWRGSWNGYFGKEPNADQESFCVYDDDYYGKWNFFPDSRDNTRRGMGLKVEQRGFQWANIQSRDVIFWHYDIANEGTTIYDYDVIFGLYNDSGVGGSSFSPFDHVYESDDDAAYFDTTGGMNLVYTWDYNGHGNFGVTGYCGYAYLETPGNSIDGNDNDEDGITDEKRDGGPGEKIVGKDAIREYVNSHYDVQKFENYFGPLENRPAYMQGVWWTGDEDMDWIYINDTGGDGVWGTHDSGENDSIPTAGERNFDKTDIDESDQIGLTGFKLNRIRVGAGGIGLVDDIIFYMDSKMWPQKLYEMWSGPTPFENSLGVTNYNIGFFFASGPFYLNTGTTERFSLALAFGVDLFQLRKTTQIVQKIYNANYQFSTPPPLPTVHSYAGDGFVNLTWNNAAEFAFDPITNTDDFEGYKIYRSTDETFLDPQIIYDAQGLGLLGNGKPLAVFDLEDGIRDYTDLAVEGVQYFLGNDSGLKHSFKDTTAVNGQRYFYAVTAYDRGTKELDIYPSENSISVNQTLRGGLILPKNVVEVYANGRAPGYMPGTYANLEHAQGFGYGNVTFEIPNPDLIPKNHTFEIRFKSQLDSIKASSYEMYDVTNGRNDTIFLGGTDFLGLKRGPVGMGILPVINTINDLQADTVNSGFLPNGQTNMVLKTRIARTNIPANAERPNYPADYTIIFDDVVLDTSIARVGVPAVPVKFKIIGRSKDGVEFPVDFRFFDSDGNQTISANNEFIEILGSTPPGSSSPRSNVWTISVDNVNGPKYENAVFPRKGDVYQLIINVPYNKSDIFRFTTDTSFIDLSQQVKDYSAKPYVVPNPYLGMASFEQAPYAQTGRGERRIEFRGLPVNAVVRIYTVTGELVQTLHHDAGFQNYIAWNLRSKDNLEIAPGLYIYHVEAPGVDDFIGKFAVIK
ncbi:MAG TPA: hypothetical protein VMT35_01155 [Ignavibacteriaceae bacterium]|nr:hypothetical protein [Ignavibacteriaceae bacterium]